MADNTAKAEDTGLSDADLSTGEELEDSDFEDELTTEELEQAEETDESEEAEDDSAATDESDDSEEESDDDSSDSDESVEEDKTEVLDEAKADAQVAKNTEAAAREAFLARQRAKADAQKEYLQGANEAYDLALQRGLSEDEARMEANRDLAFRQLQIDSYNNKVEGNQNWLQNGIDKAVASVDLFKSGTQLQKEALADSLDTFEALYVRKDQNGDPIEVLVDPHTGVKADVHAYLQREAARIKLLTQEGAKTQDKAKTNQKSRTLAPPSKAPKKAKSDPGLDAFDEEADW